MMENRFNFSASLLIAAIFLLSGCAVQEQAETVTTELTEAYENVATGIEDLTEWTTTKVDQIEKAGDDVKEAAESVDQAIDSVQAVTGGDDEKATETTSGETLTEGS